MATILSPLRVVFRPSPVVILVCLSIWIPAFIAGMLVSFKLSDFERRLERIEATFDPAYYGCSVPILPRERNDQGN